MYALQAFDATLFRFLNGVAVHPFIDPVMVVITTQDYWYPVLLGGWLALIIWGGRRGRLAAVMVVVAIALSDQLSSAFLKPLIGRVRPCNALPVDEVRLLVHRSKGLSFPSSHAANSFSMATVIAWRFKRRAWIFLVIAALIAYSRVYVGVHYPVDIVAGTILGILCGRAAILIVTSIDVWLKKWLKKRRRA